MIGSTPDEYNPPGSDGGDAPYGESLYEYEPPESEVEGSGGIGSPVYGGESGEEYSG